MGNKPIDPRADVNMLVRFVDKYFVGNQQVLMKIVARCSPAFLMFVFNARIEFTKWETHAMIV